MVFIQAINKNIWPFYLKPKHDELFTSWIYRMAIKSNTKPIPFVKSCFGKESSFWNRDIDLIIPSKIIDKTIKHTPLKKADIIKMSLKTYEGFAFESIKLNSRNLNIGSIGINHRKRQKYGLVYCPICVKQNYYRTSWRLLTSLICVKCNQYLLDRCGKCYSPISFHRINIGNKNQNKGKVVLLL
ncbi:TniQ family protein [Pseudofulvibacter geojedonensis]|uniref:TniQ family protein n=1 Tax=Pseudofulvibacter geojedonensis TaxID=1123758 RepID=A0ABW3HYA7_9FLAO